MTQLEDIGSQTGTLELADEGLTRSKGRFASGIAGSVEMVQAEHALPSTRDSVGIRGDLL